MNFVCYFGLILLGCVAIVRKYRWRALYVVTVVAYLQNFVLAYLYTNHLAGRDLLWCAILAKEILLLTIFVYSCRILLRYLPAGLPAPLWILGLFTLYCVGRIGLGMVFLHDRFGDSARMLRMVCFPLEVCCIALAVVLTDPNFMDRYLVRVCRFVVVLSLAGTYLALFSGPDFWANHVNLAAYNIDVKGDDPFYVVEDLGVSATALGREQFLNLIPFRAMGTFGDPLAMGFALVVPIFLLMFHFERKSKWWTGVALGILSLGLFLTLSRSSWILAYIVILYVIIRTRRYVWVATVLLAPVLLVVSIPSLMGFASEDIMRLSWSSPGGEHAEGIVWFYQRGFTDMANLFGKGMSPEVQKIPESGYAFLLEHFGLFAYVSFLCFLFSVFRWLGRHWRDQSGLVFICQGVVIATFVVMHFSQYPFAFIEWLMLWLLLGFGLAHVWCKTSRVWKGRVTDRSDFFPKVPTKVSRAAVEKTL